MTTFLFTMLVSPDLGLPSRVLPLAVELRRRGHTVACCNPEDAPSKLIAQAGLENLPFTQRWPASPVPATPRVYDADHFAFIFGYGDEDFARATCQDMQRLIAGYGADVVVDAWNLSACLAARVLEKPLVTVLQADMHPMSRGFLWWCERPPDVPTPVAALNAVRAGYGLPALNKAADLFAGDLTLIAGIPETDPLPAGAPVTYIGPMLWSKGAADLPAWLDALPGDQPLIWVYPGNPRYDPGGGPTIWDSIEVLRASMAALTDEPVQVVVTGGHQPLPADVTAWPANFHYAPYLPGLPLAERSSLMIHHGGHGSYMMGLYTGTPAVIIPTYSERESNARRNAALGAGEFVIPVEDASGEKRVSAAELRVKVRRVLGDPAFRRNARRVGERMRGYGGVVEAANHIERFAAQVR